MAHFAEIDADGTVLQVLVVDNENAPDPAPEVSEPAGQAFLASLGLGGLWLQTSYSSRGGKRYDPATGDDVSDLHFRYNFAAPGMRYDATLDAFIPPQPFPSWTLNPETALWDAPVPMPAEGGPWTWDEKTLSWVVGTL